MDMQGIELLEGDVWGHRKDLDEYFTVEDATLNEIRSLAASGANMDDMAAQIQKYKKTMSDAMQVFMDMQGVELLQGDVWGHRKDLDEYFTVEDATLIEIRSMAASGTNMDDVAAEMHKKARLGSDLIKYIAKTKITA